MFVVCSLLERFASSEAAQAALCRRPLHRALQLYSQTDASDANAADHGKWLKENSC